jgi:transcriptional regulator with XRE-family HTH domain
VSNYLHFGVSMNKQILIRFGKRVREERESRDISQERLGQLAKVHRTYIGMIERAERNITLTNMEKIARALGMRLSDLIDF